MRLFKKFSRTPRSDDTSKDIALNPIRFNNTVLIPLHHLEMNYTNDMGVMIFGKSDPIGIVKIKNNIIELLSINNSETLETLKTNIPELSNLINSVTTPEEVL